MDNNIRQLLNILKAVANLNEPAFEPFNAEGVLQLAEKHGVLTAVYPTLKKRDLLDEDLKKRFKVKYLTYLSQQTAQDYFSEKLFAAFDGAGIDFLPLKGARVRKYYPNSEFRTSSDVDIYIDAKNAKLTESLMQNLGIIKKSTSAQTDVYLAKPFVSFEIHKELENNGKPHYYDKLYERAIRVSEHHYEFSPSDEYIYNLAHIAKHFYYGGSGIRSILDFYLMNKNGEFDDGYLAAEIDKLELKELNGALILLGKIWFSDGGQAYYDALSIEDKAFIDDFSDYVLQSGTYGTLKAFSENAVSRSSKKGAFLKRVFLPYRSMRDAYPILKPLPILLPFMWVWRIFSKLFTNGKRVKTELKYILDGESETIKKQGELLKKLKLHKTKQNM